MTSSVLVSSSRSVTRTATQSGLADGCSRVRGPKYLNSPATPLFDKSRTLYPIDKAKGPIRKLGQAVIVEGYTDALMAHQAGFENVVASLGTALTPGQVALLTRYATRIVLAYDVDAAGEKAGGAGMSALVGLIGELQKDTSGVKLEDVRVARLPDGKDPDEVVRESPAVWETAIAKAKPLLEYLIDYHTGRFDLKTSSGRIGFVEAVMPAIREVEDPLRRDEAIGQVRLASGVEDRVLRQVLERPARNPISQSGPSRITADSVLSSPDALPIHDILRAITPVESELLRLLLLVPDEQLRVVNELGPDQLPSTVARELFRAIVLQRAPDDQGIHPPFDAAALLLALDDETAALARALYAKNGPGCARARPGAPGLRDHPTAPRARGRPAARPQRLQRGRPGGGRAGRRSRRDRPADARTTSDQRSAPVTGQAPRPDPASRRKPEVTHVRRSPRQATRGGRPVAAPPRQGGPRRGQDGRPAPVAPEGRRRRGRRRR